MRPQRNEFRQREIEGSNIQTKVLQSGIIFLNFQRILFTFIPLLTFSPFMTNQEQDNPHRNPIEAHGNGPLTQQVIPKDEEETLLGELQDVPSVQLDTAKFWDAQLIGRGVYSPLEGFMNEDDYHRVQEECRLENGTIWPIPIVLPVEEDRVDEIQQATRLQLNSPNGEPAGVLEIPEVFERNQQRECELVYQTTEREHPGVNNLLDEANYAVSGTVRVFDRPLDTGVEGGLQMWPLETRQYMIDQGWDQVVGFQTRNPMHRAHEYLVRCALEMMDATMVHPLVGPTKGSDVPATVRMKCYQAVLNNYYPNDRTLLNVFPAPMRYAGPREAVFHAVCRKNYGCTHFIVGRDHAGVGDYYGTYEAQNFISRFPDDDLGVTPLFFEFAFHCKKCEGMGTAKTCPHEPENHVFLSGTKVREKLRNGEDLPVEFTRKEVADILMEHYQS